MRNAVPAFTPPPRTLAPRIASFGNPWAPRIASFGSPWAPYGGFHTNWVSRTPHFEGLWPQRVLQKSRAGGNPGCLEL